MSGICILLEDLAYHLLCEGDRSHSSSRFRVREDLRLLRIILTVLLVVIVILRTTALWNRRRLITVLLIGTAAVRVCVFSEP